MSRRFVLAVPARPLGKADLEAGVEPLLDAPMANSLGQSAAIARLWAAALDAVTSPQMLIMATLAQKLVDNCAAMSGAQLAAAMGL